MTNYFNYRYSSRFAFRKEYFGGLFLDFKAASYELLNKNEFQFLKTLKRRKKFYWKEEKRILGLENFIDKLRQKGVIQINRGEIFSVSLREIKPPEKMPQDYLSAPLKVFDTYTSKCNLGCKHCYASSKFNFTEKRRNLVQTKALMRRFHEVGVIEWNFTGGEPTTAPDLLSAIKTAKEFGMRVAMNTNGYWNHKMTTKILNSGIDEIILSLEGREATHDERRSQGSFRRAIKTLNQIHKHKYKYFSSNDSLKVILNTVIAKDNIGDIEFIVKLAMKYKYDVKFVPLKPSGRAAVNLLEKILYPEEYMEFANKVQILRENYKVKKSGTRIILNHKDLFCPEYLDKSIFPYPFNYSTCSALTTAIDILPDGRIIPCSFLINLPEYIGPNIIDTSIYRAWQHPIMENFRKLKKRECTACKFYMKQCRGHCRSTVLLNNGKIKGNELVGLDPCCFKSLLDRN